MFMGCSLTCVNASFEKQNKKKQQQYFSHNLPFLLHCSVPSLVNTLMISCFYEAPPSDLHNGLRLARWLSVL